MSQNALDMNQLFPLINLEGDPKNIGYTHGKLLKDRIKKTIEFYNGIFNRSENEIFQVASKYKQIIAEFNSKYCEEIEGIAEGADVNPLWIYALNSRTELITTFVNECTAVYVNSKSLLAQNWDWAEELEKLAVITRIKQNDNTILQMTEPGIIGKIGLNSHGLGVTLNFLHVENKLLGVPIHIVLRAILECKTIDEVREIVKKSGLKKASNIIVGTTNGFMNLEFAYDKLYVSDGKHNFTHTNHFLSDPTLNKDHEKLASSFARFKVASERVNSLNDIEDIKNLLADRTDKLLPICRNYVFNEDIGNVGTICSIIMDLKNLVMHITPGNPFNNKYITIPVLDDN